LGNIVVGGRIILKLKEIRCMGMDWIHVAQDRKEQVPHANFGFHKRRKKLLKS
jgi:hypothetical protein